MNSAPSQPPVPSVPNTSPVNSPPSPAPPPTPPVTITPPINSVISSPINNQHSTLNNSSSPVSPPPITNNLPTSPGTGQAQPTTISSPPPPKKFPFMMVTFFLVIVLAGFVGSYLFFSYNVNKSVKTPAQVLITPPITLAPTQATENPFATASGDLGNNPFASPTAVINPFGSYQNPFGNATISATPKPVVNPFK